MQVLEGLETYIATEDFLHKLEQASAEWIDLSEHEQHQKTPGAAAKGLELTRVRNTAAACGRVPAVAPHPVFLQLFVHGYAQLPCACTVVEFLT